MHKVSFIIQGSLKHIQKVRDQITAMAGEDIEVTLLQTTRTLEAISLSEQAIRNGANYVISVGGDGMVNEVVNGYMNAPGELRNTVALGIFPSGKGNDYVKSLGVSGELQELFELIRQNKTKSVDLGLVKFKGLDGQGARRYFNNISDVGLGGYIVQDVDLTSTFINANITYQKAIIKTFLTYKHIRVRLESDDFTWEGPILSLILAKGRYFGSGLCIAPDAVLDDGQLALVLVGNVSLWDYLKNLGKIRKGIKLDHPEATYRTIGDCKITPIEGKCPIDMDGEFIGYGPLEVKVIPRAVQFLSGRP